MRVAPLVKFGKHCESDSFCTRLLLLAPGTVLFDDQVTLKHGDRLMGTVIKADTKNVVMKTEFAGDVTIQWNAIREMT